jgi:hypothetical protein
MTLARLFALGALPFIALLHGAICSPATQGPRHEFQFFAGYSPNSVTVVGSEPDRSFALAGFSYGYLCRQTPLVNVYFTPTIMPVAVLAVPAQTIYRFDPQSQRQVQAHSVYGFGVAPLGFTFEFGRRKMRPFLETMGGLIASTEPIPENQPNASGLNFLFDFGGGVRIRTGQRHAVTLGYRFLHISNAGTTSFNPGVDSNVIYFGYSFLR